MWLGKRGVLLVVGGGAAIVAIGFLVVYFFVFPTSSPKPFKLTNSTVGMGTSPPAPTTPTTLSGNWTVSSGSQAGYRVREKLAFLPAESDAVGRTSQITGSATFSEAHGLLTVTAASFEVEVSRLKSDRSLRDEKLHEIGLESDRYPTATFRLAKPVHVRTDAVEAGVVHTSVTGTLAIHGVTRSVTIPVEMALRGSAFEAIGSLTFPWGEFAMTAPSIGGFVNVSEHATMEFNLRLQHLK